jgi:hypothetical protein
LRFDVSGMIGTDWAPDPLRRQQYPEPGTVIALLDDQDFCLGIGLVEKILPKYVAVFSPPCDPAAVARLKLGKIRLDRDAGFVEIRSESSEK